MSAREMKKIAGCVLAVATFLYGLLVVVPALILFTLLWMLTNYLLWVFNKGMGTANEISVGVIRWMALDMWILVSARRGRWGFSPPLVKR